MNTPHGGAAFAAYRLDDPELVEAGDPGGMLRQVASSAAQVRTALRACEESDLSWLRPDARPRAIIVAGAGVGVLAGEILAAIVGQWSPVQVLTVSSDTLPGWVGAADIVVAPSSSGHTVEAVALAREAARRGCGLLAVAPAGSGAVSCPSHWVGSWSASPSDASTLSPTLVDQTLRMIVAPHLGGSILRVHLSNRFGAPFEGAGA